MRFFSPFETGVRLLTGWRWYHRFLAEHDPIWWVEADCWTVLIEEGLVIA